MRSFSRILISLILGLSACKPADSSTLSTALTNEDYRVYSAYLNRFEFYKNAPSNETIVVTDSTTMRPGDIHPQTTWAWVLANMGDRCRYLKDTVRCRKAKDPAWAQLFERVKQLPPTEQEFLLPSKFTVSYPIQLLSQLKKRSINPKLDLYSRPYYIFGMSKITYNSTKTKALFFGSFICGGTCGRGDLIMLEKAGQTWSLIDTFRFWIA